MEKQATVEFRNVGQLYFPQTRVECHYSLTSEHQWSSRDWIGIFQMGWSSIKQYHTYTWAVAPEGYTKGTSLDYFAHFQPFYLPRPSAVEYQFVYVDEMGKVCARSRPFTFCVPKPLEELETLKEEQDEEDEGEEMLLVVPRAQLLQSQLEESLKKQQVLQQALDEFKKKSEEEKENSKKGMTEWEGEREAMKVEIIELRESLRHSCEILKRVEGKHKDVKYSQENLTAELSNLMAEKAESQLQVKELEDDIKVLSEREAERSDEVDRLKERLKKMSNQMKHDEEKRKSLQAEKEAAVAEARGLQERLLTAEHVAESLRRELKELGSRQAHIHNELHQNRMQVAQLNLQLSEENLLLREERANWALEREAFKHSAEIDKKKLQDLSCEVERKEEWLQEERMEREKLEAELTKERENNKVLKCDAKRELQEMKASLRKGLKGREEENEQDLVSYIRLLEQRSGVVGETQPNAASLPRSISSPLFLSAQLEQPDRLDTHTQIDEEDTQEEKRQACGGIQLIIPQLVNPILSELADSPMW